MIYKIRVILNAKEDVIRDIAIDRAANLEDLHNAIANSFGFAGDQMASFYRSDEEWIQGEEHPLFDMSEGADRKVQMRDVVLQEVFSNENDRMLYVYDFFNMWSFYVELIQTDFQGDHLDLPGLIFSLGLMPSQAPDIQFESEDLSEDEPDDEDHFEEFDDDFSNFNFN